jgi:DNA invertase Pin-like site-specific DNA recombinase
VRIEFLKEHLIFTGDDSPMANLMLSVMGAFAEFERALIGERQWEGITLAKARGAYRRRRMALTPTRASELRKRAGAGEQKTGLAREFSISRETLYQSSLLISEISDVSFCAGVFARTLRCQANH